jgi:hypothetical protein
MVPHGSITEPPIISSGCYHLTEDDSVQAGKLDVRPSRALLIIYGIASSALVALCIAGPLKMKVIVGFTLIGGIVGETITRNVIIPARRRLSYRRNELLHNEFTIEINDRDMRIFSIKTKITLTSENVVKWKEGKDHILIYIAPRMYFTLPKRLATTTFDLDILRARLRKYTGAPTR